MRQKTIFLLLFVHLPSSYLERVSFQPFRKPWNRLVSGASGRNEGQRGHRTWEISARQLYSLRFADLVLEGAYVSSMAASRCGMQCFVLTRGRLGETPSLVLP